MWRLCIAPVFVLALTAVAVAADPPKAEEFSSTGVFRLSPILTTSDDPAGTTTLRVRPNTSTLFQVYAQNPLEDDGTYVVELRGGAKNEVLGRSAPVTIVGGKWKRVLLAKPPAPPVPPVVVAPAPAAPAAEPPPPGAQLPRGSAGFGFTLRLLDEKGEAVKDKDGKPYGSPVAVQFTPATDYVKKDTEKPALTAGSELTFPVSAKDETDLSPIALRMSFPPPAGAKEFVVSEGVLVRTLKPAVELDGTLKGTATFSAKLPATPGPLTLHLAVDGVERAFVYESDVAGGNLQFNQFKDRRVRVYAGDTLGVLPTQPVTALPVRIETDNALASDRLELRIRRESETVGEVIPLGGPRDERLWVNAGDGGLEFSSRSSDWVKTIDLSPVRGRVLVEAVLTPADGLAVSGQLEGQKTVIVDAAAPVVSDVTVGDPDLASEKVVKGKPVAVRASVVDVGEAGVQKVSFLFFAKFLPDGKVPPDAVQLPASQSGTDADVWEAELPLPADQKGKFFVAAVAADEAGNVSPVTGQFGAVKEIELIDPKPGFGAVSGVVTFGTLPQPGLKVVLAGADGKAKATATTSASGKFCFQNIAPGPYTLVTAKASSGLGFSGLADVTVEADKTVKKEIELVRNK